MLPQYLQSSYLQYKSMTDDIATWLATAAQRCGFTPNLQVVEEACKPKKLKGRARMLAKQAAKAETAKKGTESRAYAIPLKDFLPMARRIAAFQKPPVQVPDSFSKILHRTISLRKAAAFVLENCDRAGPHCSTANQKSDTGHSSFTHALEGVREALQSRMTVAAREKIETSPPIITEAIAEATLTSVLSDIAVEGPSEATLSSADKAATQKPQERYQAEKVADLEDAFLRLVCLLTDFSRIRTVVSETWTGYKNGILNLVSASIATNTAMELARYLEEEQQKAFTVHGGMPKLLERYYIYHCRSENQDPHSRELPGDEMNFDTYEIADSLFLPPLVLLDAYLGIHTPGSMSLYKPGTYGVYDASADRSKMSNREKFKEDKIVFLEILPDFTVLALDPKNTVGFDEFTRGLCEALGTKKRSLWLSLSIQLFLDIHHILRVRVACAFQDLCRIGHAIQGSINQNLEFHRNLKINTWPASNDDALRQLVDLAQSTCLIDIVMEARAKIRAPRGFDVGKHRFKKNHPVLCGLEMYKIKAKFNEASTNFARAWGSVVCTGHLYNAIRQEKLLIGVWKDMEFLFAIENEEHLFEESRPASAGQCIKVCHSGGNLTKHQRAQSQPAVSTREPQSMEEGPPVHNMFLQRYCQGVESTVMTTQDVEKILSKSSWLKEANSEDDSKMVLGRHSNTEAESRLKKKWNATQQVTIPELLHSLQLSLQAEVLGFSFDYFLMHRQCWQLLRSVKEAAEPRMRGITVPPSLKAENQLPQLVSYIFMDTQHDENSARQSGLQSPVLPFHTASRELLGIVAGKVNEMIAANTGDVVLNMMQKLYNVKFQVEQKG